MKKVIYLFVISLFAISNSFATNTITPATLPSGYVQHTYSQNLISTGSRPFTWSVSGGSLPAGISLTSSSSNQALLSGTFTTAGVSTFTISTSDQSGTAGKKGYTITVTQNYIDVTNLASLWYRQTPTYPLLYDTWYTLANTGDYGTGASAVGQVWTASTTTGVAGWANPSNNDGLSNFLLATTTNYSVVSSTPAAITGLTTGTLSAGTYIYEITLMTTMTHSVGCSFGIFGTATVTGSYKNTWIANELDGAVATGGLSWAADGVYNTANGFVIVNTSTNSDWSTTIKGTLVVSVAGNIQVKAATAIASPPINSLLIRPGSYIKLTKL